MYATFHSDTVVISWTSPQVANSPISPSLRCQVGAISRPTFCCRNITNTGRNSLEPPRSLVWRFFANKPDKCTRDHLHTGQRTEDTKLPPQFGFAAANQQTQKPASFCFVLFFFSQDHTGAGASPHYLCVSLCWTPQGGDPVEAAW